jgi:hypothetical protein
MNLKSLLSSAAVVTMIGATMPTLCAATQFSIEREQDVLHLKSNSANQVHFNNKPVCVRVVDEDEINIPKVPIINFDSDDDEIDVTSGLFLVGLLPAECNINVPKGVTQVAPGQLKVFLVANAADEKTTADYYPHYAVDPMAAEIPKFIGRRAGEVRIVGSDSKSLYLKRVATVNGRPNPEQFTIDPVKAPITFSQAHSKALHITDGFPSDKPIQIAGFQPNQPNSFWSCFEYVDQGQTKAVVGLHMLFNLEQLGGLLVPLRVMARTQVTKLTFLKALQAVGNLDAFKGHGHIPKLMSLFNDEFSMGSDVACRFILGNFGGEEHTHRWATGSHSSVELRRDNDTYAWPKRVSFVGTKACLSAAREQQIDVVLNGNPVKSLKYNAGQNLHTIDVDIPADWDVAIIGFNAPNVAVVPGDGRALSIAFSKVKLTY